MPKYKFHAVPILLLYALQKEAAFTKYLLSHITKETQIRWRQGSFHLRNSYM
jgi:hypothetical protein